MKKKSLKDMLHSIDSASVEHIAGKYKAADRKTAERIYKKCSDGLYKENSSGEVFSLSSKMHRARILPIFIFAACILVMGFSVAGLTRLKAPDTVTPDTQAPIITQTVSASTTLCNTVTTSEAAGATAEAAQSGTTVPESPAEPSTGASSAAVPDGNSAYTEAPDAKAGEAAQTTSARTEPAKTVPAQTEPVHTMTTTALKPPVTTTTLPEDEMKKQLDEIRKKEAWNIGIFVRQRAETLGQLPAGSPRITVSKAKEITSSCDSFKEAYLKLLDVYKYPDFIGGSGITRIEFWIGDDRVDCICFLLEECVIFYGEEKIYDGRYTESLSDNWCDEFDELYWNELLPIK